MSFKDKVLKTRSCRRFYGDFKITENDLLELIELARLTGSAANLQALRFMPVCSEEGNARAYETLGWAGYLKEWPGPDPAERPSGYIIILTDLSRGKNRSTDIGIAAQTIMLGATEKGLGGCMFGNINRSLLAQSFGIDTDKYEINLCLALGKPKEEIHIVDMDADGSVAYYRDENGVHYVPKRKLEDIIL